MSTAARNELLPPANDGLLRGATLALLAHAGLLLALTTVLQWRSSAPEAVSAELWSAVPQAAAPAAVPAAAPAPVATLPPPPPPPSPPPTPAHSTAAPTPPKVEPALPDPQIAVAKAQARQERERRQKAEQAERDKTERTRQERERKEREADARARAMAEAKKREQEQLREQKAQEQRLAEQRQRNLDRLMSQAGGSSSGSPGATAAQTSGPSASYSGRLIAAIKPNIVFTDAISGNPAAEVEVRAGPSGSILSRRLVRSSGHKEWDEAVLRAIDRTATLPRDVDGRVPGSLLMAFRPQE